MIWETIWTVLMMFWLFFGCYIGWDQSKPWGVGNTIIPWLCVLILGLLTFGGISRGRQQGSIQKPQPAVRSLTQSEPSWGQYYLSS